MKLYTEKKQTIDIESTPFSKGGEGGVYRIMNTRYTQKYCAKVYHCNTPQDRAKLMNIERKIHYMLTNPTKWKATIGNCLGLWHFCLMHKGNLWDSLCRWLIQRASNSQRLWAVLTLHLQKEKAFGNIGRCTTGIGLV